MSKRTVGGSAGGDIDRAASARCCRDRTSACAGSADRASQVERIAVGGGGARQVPLRPRELPLDRVARGPGRGDLRRHALRGPAGDCPVVHAAVSAAAAAAPRGTGMPMRPAGGVRRACPRRCSRRWTAGSSAVLGTWLARCSPGCTRASCCRFAGRTRDGTVSPGPTTTSSWQSGRCAESIRLGSRSVCTMSAPRRPRGALRIGSCMRDLATAGTILERRDVATGPSRARPLGRQRRFWMMDRCPTDVFYAHDNCFVPTLACRDRDNSSQKVDERRARISRC